MTTEHLAAINDRRRLALDRYRGAFLGLALADGAAARDVLGRLEELLSSEDANLLDVRWPDGVVLGALAALWFGGDFHAADSALGTMGNTASARRVAAVTTLILAETPHAALSAADPPLDDVVGAVVGAPSFEEGARQLAGPQRAIYGLLAGASLGESGLPAAGVAALPQRAVARAVAGAIFEQAWTPAPPGAPDIVCEHCRSLLEKGIATP